MISMVEKQELNFVIPEKAWSTSEVTIERIKGRFDWSDYSNPSSSNSNFKIYTLTGKFNMILTANSFNKQRERCLEKNISFYPVLPYSKWKSHLSFKYKFQTSRSNSICKIIHWIQTRRWRKILILDTSSYKITR